MTPRHHTSTKGIQVSKPCHARGIATSSFRLAGLFAIAVAAVACLAPASALAATAHEYESSFGPDCTEATHFENPGAVAVDQQTHDVYVADLEAGTVSKFDENNDGSAT